MRVYPCEFKVLAKEWCSLRSVFFRSLRTKADNSVAGKPCYAFCCSWVLRSLVRIEEREEREKGVGVFGASLAGWLSAAVSCLLARRAGVSRLVVFPW